MFMLYLLSSFIPMQMHRTLTRVLLKDCLCLKEECGRLNAKPRQNRNIYVADFSHVKAIFDLERMLQIISLVLTTVYILVVKTFKNSTAERVQSAPIYLRYIRIPFQINCRASAERVQLGPIYLRYISCRG